MLTTARSYRVISICVVVFIGFVAAFAGKLYIASNAAEARGHENLSLELVGEFVTAASSADDQPARTSLVWKGYTWNLRDGGTGGPGFGGWSNANVTGPDGNDYLTISITNP